MFGSTPIAPVVQHPEIDAMGHEPPGSFASAVQSLCSSRLIWGLSYNTACNNAFFLLTSASIQLETARLDWVLPTRDLVGN
jgi:hypothetical protein